MNPDTKTRILDAAEQLIAEHGFAATSMRAITAGAGVNLAAVNYHFQSKEALLTAVMERRIAPMNRHRLELLDGFESRAGAAGPALEDVVDAFVSPMILSFAGTPFVSLLGRMYMEPGDVLKKQLALHMQEIAGRFGVAFRRCLPGVPLCDLAWSIHFSIGAVAHSLAVRSLVRVISGGRCDVDDYEGVRRRLMVYICAGLRAFEMQGDSQE